MKVVSFDRNVILPSKDSKAIYIGKKVHLLKIHPDYFWAVHQGKKRFEIRKNDRDFKVGEAVRLFEYCEHRGFSLHYIDVVITFLTDFEQKEGFVVFGFEFTKFDPSYEVSPI